jgi:hypothetical protein
MAPFFLFAQTQPKVSMVEVILEGKEIRDLAVLGLETDHGFYREGSYLINVFSEKEILKIKKAGFDIKIIEEDVVATFNKRNLSNRSEYCNWQSEVRNYQVPENFKLGSMGGYFTYQEMLDNLDSMAAKYPELITSRAEIDTFKTHDGNPLYWIKLSDNANVDEPEKEVLYTALHHAREPGGLSQLIFFMWYLLENYETDSNVKYLVDNTELFFIPCINPDGYLYNESTNPYGGGFWRKNRRDNLDGSFGVDLNRNYGFGWGYDDQGSSPSTDDQTYRGPEAFSEPETQAVKYFCEQHEFYAALNYHTYGNLLIYPWGYLDAKCPDSTEFSNIANAMTLQNNFVAGVGTETVGYTVNGDSDDWMYGEQATKPKIYAMTPEVGESFWPDSNLILEHCRRTFWTNFMNVNFVHVAATVEPNVDILIKAEEGELPFKVTRFGIEDGTVQVNFRSLDGNISFQNPDFSYDLTPNEEVLDTSFFTVKNGLGIGKVLMVEQTLSTPNLTWKDTIELLYLGEELPIFEEDGTSLASWLTPAQDGWGLDSSLYFSPVASIGDSPNGRYSGNQFKEIFSESPLDLSNAVEAFMTFRATWDIEPGYDYVQISASRDAVVFEPLCGRFTVEGSELQIEGQPVYDGYQPDWVQEVIDLSDFIGETQVYLRFSFMSDRFTQGEGFNFDDLEVYAIADTTSTSITENIFDQISLQVYPNPAKDNVSFIFNGGNGEKVTLSLFNQLGIKVWEQKMIAQKGNSVQPDLSTLPAGLYYLKAGNEMIEKVLIQK